MSLRHRTKSLTSLRKAAKQDDIPLVPKLPAKYTKSTTSSKNITSAAVTAKPMAASTAPPWDREIDITFCKTPRYEGDDNEPRNLSSIRSKAAIVIKDEMSAKRKLNFGAVSEFATAYHKAHKDCDGRRDETFREAFMNLCCRRGDFPVALDRTIGFNRLPEGIRRVIWGYVIHGYPDKPPLTVRLQQFAFFKDVWLPTDFQNTGELFATSRGALATCFTMRAEILAHVFTSHRFHIVFSPFVKEPLCPQTFFCLDNYTCIMQNITIELDLSKFGFGPTPQAEDLLWGNRHTVAGLQRFVDAQITRTAPIDNLVLLARRYHGLRPLLQGGTETAAYCPAEADWTTTEPLRELGGRVNLMRIVGFNPRTTQDMIAAMFPGVDCTNKDVLYWHGCRAGISKVWPFLPNQHSVHRDARYPHPTARPSQASLKVENPSTISQAAKIRDRKVSLAKSHIEKIKATLEALEEQKERNMKLDNEASLTKKHKESRQRSREASLEVEDKGTVKANMKESARSSLARLRSRSRKLSATQSSVEDDDTLLLPPIEQQCESFISNRNVANDDGDDHAGHGSSQVTAGLSTSAAMESEDDISESGGSTAVELIRKSQASDISLRSKLSICWSDEKRNDVSMPNNDSPRSLGISEKSMSMPVGNSSSHGLEESSSLKKRSSAEELRRKKSFGEYLRGTPRTPTSVVESTGTRGSNRAKRPKTPGPNSSRLLSNLTGVNVPGGYGGIYR